jgi:hypothetical protein
VSTATANTGGTFVIDPKISRPGLAWEKINNLLDPIITGIAVRP